ncbi:MAG: PAS domain-containing protein, partial [Euryarchaeota archaeon]|nr:PAS domain-containing protein [Euryarchaeota archaeon]
METNYIVPIIVVVFVALLAALNIWLVTGRFLENTRYKELFLKMQEQFDIINAQNAELVASESDVRNQHAELQQKGITQRMYITALVEASAHGMLIVNSRMRICHFNKHLCDMWDLPEEKMHIGAKVYEVFKCCMAKAFEPDMFFLNHHKTNHSRDITWNDEVRLSDGRVLQSSSSPVRGLDGTYYGRIWEFVDITERVHREQAISKAYSTIEEQYEKLTSTEEALRHQYSILKETERDLEAKNDFLHALLEASTHGILAVDSDWNIIAFNKQIYKTWDLPEDLVHIGADGWKILTSYCMTQVVDPETFVFNCRTLEDVPDMARNNHLYLSNGMILKTSFTPIIGPNDTEHGRIWEIIDITDDLVQQQELERTHTTLVQKSLQLTLALESAGEGLWTWDIHSDLFLLNPEFASQYHSISEVQPIVQFFQSIPLSERERCLKMFRDITGRCPIEFEFQLQSNEGIWHDFILRGVVSEVDDDGVPLIATGTLVDITERKRYEKHLRESNQKISLLSQITRHDIMEQLNNVFAASDLISDLISDEVSDEVSGVHIKELLKRMEQALNTVRNQVEFSRNYHELGLHGAEWQDMNECIKRITSLLIYLPDYPPVEVLADNLPMLLADPLLEKAVYKLIENSLQHGE